MGSRKPISETVQKRLTKFYVANIPDRCSGADLAEFIREFGEIYDLYIARKRNKNGDRFGFVSLLDVKDPAAMARRMSNIKMGSFVLKCNVARFILEDGEVNRRVVDQGRDRNVERKEVREREVQVNTKVDGRRSFKDVFLGNQAGRQELKKVVVPNETYVFGEIRGRALVATLVSLENLQKVGDFVRELSPGGGKIQYLGGLSVLLTFSDHLEAEAVRRLAMIRVDWFSYLDWWNGQEMGYERVAWLKVEKVPLQILNNETLDSIGGLFGKVLHKAHHVGNEGDLSYDYVGVLVSTGNRIMEEVLLRWRNVDYKAWVMEEAGDWVPDFLMRSDKEEGAVANEGGKGTEPSMEENPRYDVPGNLFSVNLEKDVGGIKLNRFKRSKGKWKGLGQERLLSKDVRPNPLKRPRLDFDPNGLDPFGLDEILGLNDRNAEGDASENVGPSGVSQAFPQDDSLPHNDIIANVEVGNIESSHGDFLEVQGKLSEETYKTRDLGLKVGAQLNGFEALVRETVEADGVQSGINVNIRLKRATTS